MKRGGGKGGGGKARVRFGYIIVEKKRRLVSTGGQTAEWSNWQKKDGTNQNEGQETEALLVSEEWDKRGKEAEV